MLKINAERPNFQALFQGNLFDHWMEIKGSSLFPKKQDFRPQNFSKVLGQLAIVTTNQDGTFSDRLTGSTICDTLLMGQREQKLTVSSDLNINSLLHTMLDEARDAAEPMYFTGSFTPVSRPSVEYSLLTTPFCGSDENSLGYLLLAFDFTKQAHEELFAIS
ncbi:MAG: PAS domain-containing protein [Kordiimonadaceae bacterium]|nr:PAS domain-containing protein [Kordiimonadaceae bacterium]